MSSSHEAPRAVIFGCEGLRLSARERDFFAEIRPLGFILFARNVGSPDGLTLLVDELRAAAGHDDVLMLIDQEGGRVQRLRPPHWGAFPPAAHFGRLFRDSETAGLEAAKAGGAAIGADLARHGINVDCAPVLDLHVASAHDIIGDRAFASDPASVAALGRAFAEGLLAAGVLPVVKHIPGHGRARCDSHASLPVVEMDAATLAATDFAPFRALADMPIAMTAHITYTALDPDAPATLSRQVIGDCIRGQIGFDGLLLTDDISMGALEGPVAARAEAALAAGCDIILHCNADMAEMQTIAAAVPALSGAAARRVDAALARLGQTGADRPRHG